MSDLDIYQANGKPHLAIELKDKPFTETEVKKAAQTAYSHSAPSMLFIAGRYSALSEEVYRYLNQAKAEYEGKGMMVGIMTIDALVDFFFATNHGIDSAMVFDLLRTTMEETKPSAEAVRWVYREIQRL